MESKELTEAIGRAGTELLGRKHFGSIEIRQVRVYVDAAREDEPTLRFELIVSSPSGSQGAWSTDDVFNLRSAVWTLLADEGIPLTPTVDLLPDTPETEDAESANDDLARALDADDRA
ncbi:MAG TPA: hypothetical protein VH081_03205 [Solirubrobacteraceae bacterium]|jgi:hypothetical protein|nr:hypothetical protein [Solirubrobacteraceae bacterium]